MPPPVLIVKWRPSFGGSMTTIRAGKKWTFRECRLSADFVALRRGYRCLRTSLATDCFLLSPEWPFLIGRFWRILLKKSFWGGERNFLGLLMRLMRGDVRDHVASQKNDHGASYRRCEASQS
jgi:hypothetical protein